MPFLEFFFGIFPSLGIGALDTIFFGVTKKKEEEEDKSEPVHQIGIR